MHVKTFFWLLVINLTPLHCENENISKTDDIVCDVVPGFQNSEDYELNCLDYRMSPVWHLTHHTKGSEVERKSRHVHEVVDPGRYRKGQVNYHSDNRHSVNHGNAVCEIVPDAEFLEAYNVNCTFDRVPVIGMRRRVVDDYEGSERSPRIINEAGKRRTRPPAYDRIKDKPLYDYNDIDRGIVVNHYEYDDYDYIEKYDYEYEYYEYYSHADDSYAEGFVTKIVKVVIDFIL